MTQDEKRAIAAARGVSVATVSRWVRAGGDDAARAKRRTSASQAGRKSRAGNPGRSDAWWSGRKPTA